MLEFDGANWARATASSNSSRGTGLGKNIRVECRSLTTCSKSNMVPALLLRFEPSARPVESLSRYEPSAMFSTGEQNLSLRLNSWERRISPDVRPVAQFVHL